MFHCRGVRYTWGLSHVFLWTKESMSILCFAGVCCLVLGGKWLIFPMYGGADCPWRLMVGVKVPRCVSVKHICNLGAVFFEGLRMIQ
jgi:hypothetical protein